MKTNKRAVVVVLLGCALLTSGCVSSILAKMAVEAPNRQRVPRVVRDAAYREKYDALYSTKWTVPVGPPAADLAVSVIEPGSYQASYSIEVKTNAQGVQRLVPNLRWKLPAQELIKPIGTVFVLHGYLDSREDVAHWGLYLASQGYRCVLVDARGHGRSTGGRIGYGAFEAKDLSRVLDDLAVRGLLVGKVGVLGVSYGGSTAILWAASDSRVRAVVALEPYSRADTAVVEFAHGVAPKLAAKISEKTFSTAVAKASKLAGFQWADTDVERAAAAVSVPVLLIHGAKDTWLSPANSERLLSALAGPKELVLLPDDDHLMLSMRLVPINGQITTWFQRALVGEVTSPESPVSVQVSGVSLLPK
jgi:pimeloyl-ACP methyl ester carboxylesterase